MLNSSRFFDTNILVYAHDSSENQKQSISRNLIRDTSTKANVVISTQVLKEFYYSVTADVQQPLSTREARDVIESYENFNIVNLDVAIIYRGISLQQAEPLSFWDGLIVASAERADCDILYTEDLNDGQTYGSVEIRNPFQDIDE